MQKLGLEINDIKVLIKQDQYITNIFSERKFKEFYKNNPIAKELNDNIYKFYNAGYSDTIRYSVIIMIKYQLYPSFVDEVEYLIKYGKNKELKERIDLSAKFGHEAFINTLIWYNNILKLLLNNEKVIKELLKVGENNIGANESLMIDILSCPSEIFVKCKVNNDIYNKSKKVIESVENDINKIMCKLNRLIMEKCEGVMIYDYDENMTYKINEFERYVNTFIADITKINNKNSPKSHDIYSQKQKDENRALLTATVKIMKYKYIDKCHPEGYRGWLKILQIVGQELYRILENNPNVELSQEEVNGMLRDNKKKSI